MQSPWFNLFRQKLVNQVVFLLINCFYAILQVERALDVAEKLVLASPDELSHLNGDLARTLV